MGIYEELGVSPLINADARWTGLGASRMQPETIQAMKEASEHYVDVPALQRAAGARIAKLTNNEDAYVAANAAAGYVIAILACITRGDERSINRLPHVDGDKREVLVHSGHRIPFDAALEMGCGRIVQFGNAYHSTPAQLEAAVTEKTAALFYVAGEHVQGALPLDATVELAHKHGIPVVVSAAAQLPPKENLWKFTRDLGADLAVFSGGKDIQGPQASGLIVGKSEFVEFCRKVGPPSPFWPRALKIGREEIVGLTKAVELYMARDEKRWMERLEGWVATWGKRVEGAKGLTAYRLVPSLDGQPVPRLGIEFGPSAKTSAADVAKRLMSSDRPIKIGVGGPSMVYLNPETLNDEECEFVIEQFLKSAQS